MRRSSAFQFIIVFAIILTNYSFCQGENQAKLQIVDPNPEKGIAVPINQNVESYKTISVFNPSDNNLTLSFSMAGSPVAIKNDESKTAQITSTIGKRETKYFNLILPDRTEVLDSKLVIMTQENNASRAEIPIVYYKPFEYWWWFLPIFLPVIGLFVLCTVWRNNQAQIKQLAGTSAEVGFSLDSWTSVTGLATALVGIFIGSSHVTSFIAIHGLLIALAPVMSTTIFRCNLKSKFFSASFFTLWGVGGQILAGWVLLKDNLHLLMPDSLVTDFANSLSIIVAVITLWYTGSNTKDQIDNGVEQSEQMKAQAQSQVQALSLLERLLELYDQTKMQQKELATTTLAITNTFTNTISQIQSITKFQTEAITQQLYQKTDDFQNDIPKLQSQIDIQIKALSEKQDEMGTLIKNLEQQIPISTTPQLTVPPAKIRWKLL